MHAFRDVDYDRYTITKEYDPDVETVRQRDMIRRAAELAKEREDRLGRRLNACVVTFGCQMNARDSEKINGVLTAAGIELTDDENADIVIYNTCTVRDNANQRVYGRLGNLGVMKKKHPDKMIVLCGCMVQEAAVIEKIRQTYPFVDMIFGTHNIYKFPELLVRLLEDEGMIIDVWKKTDSVVEDLPVVRKYPFKSGVNIMFGCDNFCSYCIVPYVRGRERSRMSGEILEEVRRLADTGVSEVMLLGQNVNSYGRGLEGEISFPGLLKEVEKVEGIRRIRFMTSHPKDLSDELIEVMAESRKICSHLHLPVQSGSSRVLEMMNRKYTRESYLELVYKLRKAMPDLSITTDIIVGFPGEEAADVDETVSLIHEAAYDNAFTFIYSKRAGTPAAYYESRMSAEEISEGFNRVLAAVQKEARKNVSRFSGRTMEALVEEVNEKDSGYVTGRLSGNVLVHFKGDASMVGTYQNIKLTENKGFYYIGERV
ncbi:MAG: tRNA (N6-isopentenyl adenosine(37)-C2)-methylthiotransferase MiaB [Lachnospiraceae bacterium]|nr:tRNA (N6-isopentenyl adenosine(37)-C2)-methylthiotransferase MiaB [Lachnospiraceae bacterium]